MSQLEVSTQWHQQWVGTVCYSKGKPWMLSTSAPSPQSPGCSQAVCQEQTFRRDSQQNATLRSIFESIEIDWVHQQSLFYIVLLQMNLLVQLTLPALSWQDFSGHRAPGAALGKTNLFSCIEAAWKQTSMKAWSGEGVRYIVLILSFAQLCKTECAFFSCSVHSNLCVSCASV